MLWVESAHFLFGRLIMDLGSSPRVTTEEVAYVVRAGPNVAGLWGEARNQFVMMPRPSATAIPIKAAVQMNASTGLQSSRV